MKKADGILIIVLLMIALMLGVVVFIMKQQNVDETSRKIVIEVNGKSYKEMDFNQDDRCVIETRDGESIIVVKNGACYMESAHCPDQICVKHNPISKVGESIICLPYQIVVSVTGSEEPEFDN